MVMAGIERAHSHSLFPTISEGGEDRKIAKSVSSMIAGMDGAAHLEKARRDLQIGATRDGWMREPSLFAQAYEMSSPGLGLGRCAVLDSTLSALLGPSRAAEFASHCSLSNVLDTPVKLCALYRAEDGLGTPDAVLQRKLFLCQHLCICIHGYAASKEVWALHLPHFLSAASESGCEYLGVAFSLFGSEGTCPNARPRSMHEASVQAADALYKLSLERRRLLLIGHSMGGNTILRMLLQAPVMLGIGSEQIAALALTPVVSSDSSFLLSLHDSLGHILRNVVLRLGVLERVKHNARLIGFFSRLWHLTYMSWSLPSPSQTRRLRVARLAALLGVALLVTARRGRVPMPALSARWLVTGALLALAAEQSAELVLSATHLIPKEIQLVHGQHLGEHSGLYLAAITKGIMGNSSRLSDREIEQLAVHATRIRVVVASDDRLLSTWGVVERLQRSVPILYCRGSHYVHCGPDFPRILSATRELAFQLI
ncbi:hypothetical protein T492DRAFT_1148841 [Pavlovales sp. CCMP2436]|nr:hypothetical protein T492DRAFT_1148841 [Pavlovales sp. CCMP2436]